ncbi:MAG: EVE domain-containing protein [SAR324 cluster bacterium]|nr:EVE domain-containing protein [SAR324 cluster bacterium]
MKYWLMKSEPNVFSIDDLRQCPQQTESWDGVRNYQARNYMRDEMSRGDMVLFYHSRISPSIAGLAEIVQTAHPDPTSWNPSSPYFDPKSTPDQPRWFMVDVRFREKFKNPLSLDYLKTIPELQPMMLLRKGSRLSIQPVTMEEYTIILDLAHSSSL